ncbi:insulin receptor substrate 2-B-like [Mastacembelus armatus]|uniref:Insulin receptor substrate 2-B-like n=1 Tax=Mastacembelus armatus TaxID=205130 RepID=A0A7N8YH72_9TELE|nr:insulin receptor substrate 2-B-like [Mastacembelus armatus]
MAEGYDSQRRSPPASSSPVSSPCSNSTQTWIPAGSPLQRSWMSDCQTEQDSLDHRAGMQSCELSSPHFYEELFCTRQTSVPLVSLAGTLMTSTGPQSDVVKQGYLGKMERNHRKYFVLRTGSHTGPSRLEWYKNQEKFAAMERSASPATLFGSSKRGVIYLGSCLGVGQTGSSRKGYTVVLYTKDQTMVLVLEDQQEQGEWYLALRTLMEEERRDEDHSEGFEDEDDGYCTLPPTAFFKEVWPVTVKPRGLGRSKSLAGETRLCLTATSLILVRVGACSDLPSVTIPLLSVRCFGRLDGLFFLELGRSAPNGPGEIWMEARDQGNPAIAQNIHEVVLETIRALRALPDFSRSPTSSYNQHQALLASKRSRPKYRDKLVNVRPLSSPLVLPPKDTEVQASPKRCCLEPSKPDQTELGSVLSFTSHLTPVRSQQGFVSDNGNYMEMQMQRCSTAVHRVDGWELGDDEEGLEYMMMSPQVSHTSSILPQDDYVTMVSPHKLSWPAHSSPSSSFQTSFNSLTSDSYSPLHPSHHQPSEHSLTTSVLQSETENGLSQMSVSCSTRLQDDTRQQQKSVWHRRHQAQGSATTPPLDSTDVSDLMAPFDRLGLGSTRQGQASPNSDADCSSRPQAAPDKSVRRCLLSSCLPSCLQG